MNEYQTISDLFELDEIIGQSYDAPVLIFKHSLTCGVSSHALREVGQFLARQYSYVVEIQRNRELSDEIARRTGIRHKSPQAIVFRDGEPTWNAGHWSITKKALGAALNAASPRSS